MTGKHNRYKEMELKFTALLIADAVVFILFLLFAGLGITWAKVITAILAIAVSVLCLGLLYFNGELLKQRSLWLTAGFAAILICLIFSLLLHYPSPNRLKKANVPNHAVGAYIVSDYTNVKNI